jgi:hypothetical protein
MGDEVDCAITGDKEWQRQEGNISNQFFVIICPMNILHQWAKEIEQFLKWNTFDVFPYTRKLGTQKCWWNDIFTKSLHEPWHWIILAMESISKSIHNVIGLHPSSSSKSIWIHLDPF